MQLEVVITGIVFSVLISELLISLGLRCFWFFSFFNRFFFNSTSDKSSFASKFSSVSSTDIGGLIFTSGCNFKIRELRQLQFFEIQFHLRLPLQVLLHSYFLFNLQLFLVSFLQIQHLTLRSLVSSYDLFCCPFG